MKPRAIIALVVIIGICCAISAVLVTIVRYNQWVAEDAKTRQPQPDPNYGARARISNTAGTKITKSGYLASPSQELLEKAISYAVQHDEAALQKLIASGMLIPLKGGLQVEIVDTKIFKGLVKIRPRGETLELWTNIEAVD